MNDKNTDTREPVDPDLLLDSILFNVPFGVLVLTTSGDILTVNPIAKNLLSLPLTPENLSAANIVDCIQHYPEFAQEMKSYIQKPSPYYSFKSGQFNERYLEITSTTCSIGFIISIYDVTEFKVFESYSVQAIISTQEKERRRLAREIHDGIGPMLSSAKLELDLFLEELREHDRDISDERILSIRNVIDTTAADLRNLSHRLMPRLLEEFGLLSAIQNMVAKLKNKTKSHIEIISNLHSQERIGRDIELNLFRCSQEMISNAIKYANANKITVQLIKHEKSLVLMVEDDGIGFNQDELDSEGEGIGLLNIETRTRSLNGNFLLESVAGKGTLISIEVPI